MQTLTPQELERLTGQKKPARQVSVLAAKGIPFRFGAGVVSVRREVAEELPIWQSRAEAGPRMDRVK